MHLQTAKFGSGCLPDDLKSADKVVIVDLTTKVAMGNDPDEGNSPYSVTVKLNDRNDRITDEALGDTVQWTVETQGSDNDRKLKFAVADGKYLNLINDSAHPFTVSEAIQYAKDGKGSVGYNYFVKGIVCKVDSTNNGAAGGISIPGLTNNSVEGTLTYWLSDNGVMKDSLKVSNTRVADVTEDGWLRTLATGQDTVTVSVPVTVTGGGTYTMSRNFRLRVITTNTRLGHFELVNDASTLQVGDSLMIVATKDDKSYAISANDQSAPVKGVYISNGKKMIK